MLSTVQKVLFKEGSMAETSPTTTEALSDRIRAMEDLVTLIYSTNLLKLGIDEIVI